MSAQREGVWQRPPRGMSPQLISGVTTVGIVGFGSIGRRVRFSLFSQPHTAGEAGSAAPPVRPQR